MKTGIDWQEVQVDVISLLTTHGSLTVTQLLNKLNEMPTRLVGKIQRNNLNWQLIYWVDKTETVIKRTYHGRYFVSK